MPKLGIEPLRRAALIDATIHEIGSHGSLDVTVSQIARRAGMSSALAHHYFGAKDQMFLAAMRHLLRLYAAAIRGALVMAQTPKQRVEAIVRGSFASDNFHPEVVAAWMHFYVLAQSSEAANRLLRVYQGRLRSNLTHALRPMTDDAPARAEMIAALIDGIYLRQSLRPTPDMDSAVALVLRALPTEPPK